MLTARRMFEFEWQENSISQDRRPFQLVVSWAALRLHRWEPALTLTRRQGRGSEGENMNLEKVWRRGSGSNRRIKVLQTSPLPLGYRALGRQ
jgi:hypothetical protein